MTPESSPEPVEPLPWKAVSQQAALAASALPTPHPPVVLAPCIGGGESTEAVSRQRVR